MIIVGQLEAGIGRHVADFIKYCNTNIILVTDVEKSEDSLVKEVSIDRVIIKNLKIGKMPSLCDLKNIYFIGYKIRSERCSKVIGHGAKGGLYARIVKLLFRRRISAYYIPHGGVLHYSKKTISGAVYLLIEYLLSFSTNKVFFESEFSKKEYFKKIKNLDRSKYCIIPNGVDFQRISRRVIPGLHLKICCAAQVRSLKGIDVLLKALKLLKDAEVEFQCDIYGKGAGKYFNQCIEYLERANLQENVTFLFSDQLYLRLKEYNVYVQPSRSESFGLAALEAYAAGCNLVLSNVGGLRENFQFVPEVVFFEKDDHFQLFEVLRDMVFDVIPCSQKSLLLEFSIQKSVSRYLTEIK